MFDILFADFQRLSYEIWSHKHFFLHFLFIRYFIFDAMQVTKGHVSGTLLQCFVGCIKKTAMQVNIIEY